MKTPNYSAFAGELVELIELTIWLLDWRETWEAFQCGTHLA